MNVYVYTYDTYVLLNANLATKNIRSLNFSLCIHISAYIPSAEYFLTRERERKFVKIEYKIKYPILALNS